MKFLYKILPEKSGLQFYDQEGNEVEMENKWNYTEDDNYPEELALGFSDWVIANNGSDSFPGVFDDINGIWYRSTWPINPFLPSPFIECEVIKWRYI